MKKLAQRDIDLLIGSVSADFAIYKVAENRLVTLYYSPNIPMHSGRTAKEYDNIVGGDAQEIVLESDRPYVRRHMAQCLQGHDINLTYRISHKTRGFVWLHAMARCIGEMDGHKIILALFLAVSNESELYISLLDRSKTMIFVSDCHTKELLYANKEAIDNSELKSAEYLSGTCHEFFQGMDKVCPWCFVNSTREGETTDLDLYQENHNKWLHGKAQLVKWGGRDAALHYFTDVTELKNASMEIQRGRQIYETALEAAQLFEFEYDVRRQRITFMDNPCTEQTRRKLNIPAVLENAAESAKKYLGADTSKVLNLYKNAQEGGFASCEIYIQLAPYSLQKCLKVIMSVLDDATGKTYAIINDISIQKVAIDRYNSIADYFMKADDNSLGITRLNLTQDNVVILRQPNDPLLSFDAHTYKINEFFQLNARRIIGAESRERYLQIFNREALLTSQVEQRNVLSFRCRIKTSGKGIITADVHLQILVSPWNNDVEAMIYTEDVDGKIKREKLLQKITDFDYDCLLLLDIETKTAAFHSISSLAPQSYRNKYDNSGKTYPYDSICKNTVNDWVYPDERDKFMSNSSLDNLILQLAVSDIYEYTIRGVKSDSSICYKRFRCSWLDEARNIILIEQTDVTAMYHEQQRKLMKEQRLREAATAANMLKTEFLASVSHDMRTPLNAILGYAELALNQNIPADCRDYIDKIKKSGGVLKNLINETLDLSRLESGKTVLTKKPLLLSGLARDIAATVEPSMKKKQLSFSFDISHVIDKPVMADSEHLSQALLNVLSNAAKYTPFGGRVTASVECEEPVKDMVSCKFVVCDTGIGISEEFLHRIYEPFSQEHDETTMADGGSGLGLTIVKRLIEMMDGIISIRSMVGKGTEVSLRLKFKLANAASDKTEGGSAAKLRGRNVLVCEDNYMNLEIVKNILALAGVSVTCASNGQEGVDIFTRSTLNEYDAILMDLRMPVMNGYDAAKAIRELGRKDAAAVPIIALSADAYDEDVRKSLDAGMNGHIAKPFTPQQLYEALLAALQAVAHNNSQA